MVLNFIRNLASLPYLLEGIQNAHLNLLDRGRGSIYFFVSHDVDVIAVYEATLALLWITGVLEWSLGVGSSCRLPSKRIGGVLP